MIVEFKTVRRDLKECFEREQEEELGGKPGFYHSNDYITPYFIEMDDVVDFVVGKVYCNDKMYECVYPKILDEFNTPNVLISGEDFKAILEHTKNTKIKTAEEILKSLRNENYPTSI